MISSLREAHANSQAEAMTLGKVALDVWSGLVLLSLAGIGLVFLLGALVSALTVVNAWRRARFRSRHVKALARWCAVGELAEMDEALDRFWAGYRVALPQRRVR